MPTIFDTLKNSLPQQAQPVAQAPKNIAVNEMHTQDLIALYKKSGDKAAMSELLVRMRPVMTAAMTSYAPGMESQLSVKAAHLTLDALKTYDPKFGTDPKTHVFHTLKRLSRYNVQASAILPQAEGTMLDRRRMQAAITSFTDRKGRDPSMTELADLTGFSVRKLERLADTSGSVVPESATLAQETGRDTFSSSDITDNDYYEYVYSSVGDIDKNIMDWTAGKHGCKPLTNNQIASKLKMSAAAVSQRKAKIQQLMSSVRSLL